MPIPFVKMHGAANDFVVIDHRDPFLPEAGERAWLVRRMCDRRRGVGADGVLLMERDSEHDFAMVYYNADGGEADYCGNGARCLARLALDLGLGSNGTVRFRTAAGIQTATRLDDGRIRVEFGDVRAGDGPRRLNVAGRAFEGLVFTAGVPHFVSEVERLDEIPLGVWAPPLRHHPAFGAAGANVDFVERRGAGRLAMRTWERGVEAETLACGSGAIASALWAATQGSPSPVQIVTAGGDELEVEFRGIKGGWYTSLIGPAEIAFTGTWADAPVPARPPHPAAR